MYFLYCSVSDGAAVDTVVLPVSATDIDEGQNAKMEYSLRGEMSCTYIF